MRIRKSTGEAARASSRETFSVVIASQPGDQRLILIAHQPRIAVARRRNRRPVRLRVLIADENEQRPDETAAIIGSLAHEVVSRLTDVSDVARPPKPERPDVAWRVSARTGACPRLVSEIVRQAACPVIVDLDGDDHRGSSNTPPGAESPCVQARRTRCAAQSTSRRGATLSSAELRVRSAVAC